MNRFQGPYNLDEVINACAHHVWEERPDRRAELLRRGVNSKAEIRTLITQALHHPETRAFRAQYRYNPENASLPQTALCHEVYDLRPLQLGTGDLGISILLQPNRDPTTGRVYGGTCMVRPTDEFFEDQLTKEVSKLGVARDDIIVKGGWDAIRCQEQHRQLVSVEPDKLDSRNLAPRMQIEHRLAPDATQSQASRTPIEQRVREEGQKQHELPDSAIQRENSQGREL